MGLLKNKTAVTQDGKLLFIPAGSGIVGTKQNYAVTMSGVYVSESILAAPNSTASFWYIRTAGNHSTKIFYQNTASSAVEPTGSHLNLPNFNSQHFQSSASVVRVILNAGMTGSQVVRQTATYMRQHPSVSSRYIISSSGDKIFLNSKYIGLAPTDDISFTYMTGSSFSYNIIQSGSNGTIYRTADISGSATVQIRLNESAPDQLETSMEDSRSFMNVRDGFYGVSVTNALTGSNISMHGGIPLDIGFDLPNPAFIKTVGGFDILMDNANAHDNTEFRIFKDTGIAGISPGTELLTLDNNGNLSVAGTISNASGSVDGGSF
jgi:hypothetical protein